MNRIASVKYIQYRKNELAPIEDIRVVFKGLYDRDGGTELKDFEIKLAEVDNFLSGVGNFAIGKNGEIFNPEEFTNPGGHSDFGWLISVLLSESVTHKTISYDNYMLYVRKHYDEYYLKHYKAKKKMAHDFFERYFTEETKEEFEHDFMKLFEFYKDKIEAEGTKVRVLSKDSTAEEEKYNFVIPLAEKMWVCFEAETRKRYGYIV